jgi:hypothetical protein
MALVKCKECGTEVSDKATACPKCACPISAMSAEKKPATIELTSKKLKKQKIYSVVLFLLGIIIAIWDRNKRPFLYISGFIMIFSGVIWYVITRVRIWWQHR